MAETKNEQQPHSFKRKLGNTTYTVKVHFSKDTDKTFKDRVQKLIINEWVGYPIKALEFGEQFWTCPCCRPL